MNHSLAKERLQMRTLATRTTITLALMLGSMTLTATPGFAQDKGKKVVDGKNVNPNEEYNLPPNFDPNFKSKKTPRNVRVTIDFRDAQLQEVVKFYSSLLNMNFIIADTIQSSKTITIISPKPVSRRAAYNAFIEALKTNGLTLIRAGSFYKIVSAKGAPKQPLKIRKGASGIPSNASMATSIIEVENASVDDIEAVLKNFMSADGNLVKYGNQLIVTENGANLRRLVKLVKRLDRSDSNNKVFVYKIMHAEATEIQSKLAEIFEIEGASKAGSGNKRSTSRNVRSSKKKATKSSDSDSDQLDVQVSEIIADERTNQLIIVTNERSFDRIKQMIELLDVPTAIGGQINVKFLEYANAEEISSALSSLTGGARSSSSRRSTSSSRRSSGSSSPTTAQLLQGDVQISPHKPTNSLIIIANPRDFIALGKVIALLDRPRRQVYVEAVIMEINLDVNRQLGVGFNTGLAPDFGGVLPSELQSEGFINSTRGLGLGQSNFGSGFASVLGAPGGAFGILGPTLSIPGVELSIPAFAMFLQATQTDSNINVLSTPSLLTLDNEEAEIVVGDRIPFPTAAGGGAGGLGAVAGLLGGSNQSTAANGLGASALGLLGGGLLNQVQYEDVGITLRIRPQVNESKYVRLEVDQEVSAVGAPSDLGPTRTKRSIKTIVLVRDQATVVIGGLIRDDESDSETKVPFLGDIPLVGVLFRTNTKVKKKQNLVLMLTPYIIESEADLRKIYNRKREERQALLQLFQRRDPAYMRTINYDKKGGLVDRMRGQISKSVRDNQAREDAMKAFEVTGPRFRILGEEEPPKSDTPKKEAPKKDAPKKDAPKDGE